jgi:transcriptional/translational regulatory protein YebC/TACO1
MLKYLRADRNTKFDFFVKLIDRIEDDDDVQAVYTNIVCL